MDYWTVSSGPAIRTFSCRECKGIIYKGQEMKVRDGRKIRLFYHEDCYSGSADPRTQQHSSFYDARYDHCISQTAPPIKGYGKWSVQQYGYNPHITWGFARKEKGV